MLSRYIIGVLGAIIVIMCVGLFVDSKKLNYAKQELSSFKLAQIEANRKASAARAKLMKESQDVAKRADLQYSTLLSEYRTNLLRYKASQGGGNGTNHYQLQTPKGGDGPSASPGLPENSSIVISLDDAQICAVNTARLQSVHDWAVNTETKSK